jgi:D-alanyl-D-alanine carboxypeptidase
MRWLLLFFVLLNSLCSNAQQSGFEKIDRLLADYEKQNRLMGSFSIAKNGTVIYSKTIGIAVLEPRTNADTTTKYRIGSISKTFTAVLILHMVANGELSLNQTLSRFFPTWPNADAITIEHLLRHQSGMYNFGNSRDKKYQISNPESRADVLKIFETAPIAFAPGSAYDYNNANYVVLSLIAEEIVKTDFASILRDRICAPLQLKNTHAGGPIGADHNEAHSFFWKGGWRQNANDYNPTLMGAGSIHATPHDINQFYTALFTQQLLPDTLLKQMITLQHGVGMGIFQYPYYATTCYGHTGEIDYFQSFAGYFPETNTCVAICLNANREEFNSVLRAFLDAHFERR